MGFGGREVFLQRFRVSLAVLFMQVGNDWAKTHVLWQFVCIEKGKTIHSCPVKRPFMMSWGDANLHDHSKTNQIVFFHVLWDTSKQQLRHGTQAELLKSVVSSVATILQQQHMFEKRFPKQLSLLLNCSLYFLPIKSIVLLFPLLLLN